MKVLISADMEGTAGIVDAAQTAPPDRAHEFGIENSSAEFEWARRLMRIPRLVARKYRRPICLSVRLSGV